MVSQTLRDTQSIRNRLFAMKNDIELFRTRLTNFESDIKHIFEDLQRIEERHRSNQ